MNIAFIGFDRYPLLFKGIQRKKRLTGFRSLKEAEYLVEPRITYDRGGLLHYMSVGDVKTEAEIGRFGGYRTSLAYLFSHYRALYVLDMLPSLDRKTLSTVVRAVNQWMHADRWSLQTVLLLAAIGRSRLQEVRKIVPPDLEQIIGFLESMKVFFPRTLLRLELFSGALRPSQFFTERGVLPWKQYSEEIRTADRSMPDMEEYARMFLRKMLVFELSEKKIPEYVLSKLQTLMTEGWIRGIREVDLLFGQAIVRYAKQEIMSVVYGTGMPSEEIEVYFETHQALFAVFLRQSFGDGSHRQSELKKWLTYCWHKWDAPPYALDEKLIQSILSGRA